MHAILQLVAFCVAAALAGCSSDPIIFTGIEDCEVAGDEDGNGQADCADPACARRRRAGPYAATASRAAPSYATTATS